MAPTPSCRRAGRTPAEGRRPGYPASAWYSPRAAGPETTRLWPWTASGRDPEGEWATVDGTMPSPSSAADARRLADRVGGAAIVRSTE